MTIPTDYAEDMQALLGADYPAFAEALLTQPPLRGLRVNTRKLSAEAFAAVSPWPLSPSALCRDAFIADTEDRVGLHPYHHAGLFYMQEPSASAVIEALENGDFYASTGPQILELSLADDRVSIKCSPAKRIMAHLSPKKALSVYNSDGSPVTEGNFEIPENVPFIYFSVIAEDGTAARTRAFRREEFAGQSTLSVMPAGVDGC